MFWRKGKNTAIYVRHSSGAHAKTTAIPHCWLEQPLTYGDIESGTLSRGTLESVYREYRREHKRHTNLSPVKQFLKGAETFVRHEIHEVDPNSFPHLDGVVFTTSDPRIESAYVEHAYKTACADSVRRAESDANKWNRWKEIGNMWAPIPLGLLAFGSGILLGEDGVVWAAAAEFGPYLALPPAFWLKGKEHELRREIEDMESSGRANGELDGKRRKMEKYNTWKDVCTFYTPVTFDGMMTGLSLSHVISTPAGYMLPIVAAPYAAHGLGAFAMAREYAAEEKEAVFRKMANVPIRVVKDGTSAEEIFRTLKRY